MALSAYFWPQTHATLSKDLDTEALHINHGTLGSAEGTFEKWPKSPLWGLLEAHQGVTPEGSSRKDTTACLLLQKAWDSASKS